MSHDSTFEKQSWDFEGRRFVKSIFDSDTQRTFYHWSDSSNFQQNISGRKNEELNLNPLIYGSIINVLGEWSGYHTGKGEKLTCSQAETGQAIKSAVAYFPSISGVAS